MKALVEGRYRGCEGGAAMFDVGQGATIAVRILERDLGRVTLRRAGGFRLDRGWSLAPSSIEPPYEGRDRDDQSGFASPAVAVTAGEDTAQRGGSGTDGRGHASSVRHCLASR